MTSARKKRDGTVLAAVLALLCAPFLLSADVESRLRDLFPVPSTTGNEGLLAGRIRSALPGNLAVEEDGLGGFAVRLGAGEPELLVIAALDGYGFFVSGVTPDGYLTLDRPGPAPHAQFDAYLLGQPVLISTRRGPLQGVVAQPAMHLLTPERRRTLVEEFSLDSAYVDIAVRTEKEARDKGVEILDAVTFWPVLTELAGGRWSGPSLGLKAVCAALAETAAGLEKDRPAGAAVLVWAAQTKFAARGRTVRTSLGALRAKNRWRPRRVILVDLAAAEKGASSPALGKGPAVISATDPPSLLLRGLEQAASAKEIPFQRAAGTESPLAAAFNDPAIDLVTIALPVQFIHTPSEIIDLKDLRALGGLLGLLLKTGGAR